LEAAAFSQYGSGRKPPAARNLEIALRSEPEPTLRDVLEFIGEPYDPIVMRPFA